MKARAGGLGLAVAVLAIGVACDRAAQSEAGRDVAAAMDRAGAVMSDAQITTTIQGKYFASREVKGSEIDVDTNGGVVTLTGHVDSDNARQQAVQIARGVEGVSRVEDRLRIASDAAPPAITRGVEERSPAWITTKIQAQYYMHPGLKPWNIDVTTSQAGVVRLTGEIDSAADRAEAVKIASATDGVTRVEDRLHGKGEAGTSTAASIEGAIERVGGATADGWITTKIQSRYFLDDEVKGRNIDVDTNEGVVTLQGTVESHTEHMQALAIARNTEGVREVRDQLRLERQDHDVRGTAGHEADRVGREVNQVGRQGGRETREVGQRIDDAWITTKIQAKYFAATDVKSRHVDVDTRNGVVTLKGVVDTPAAREMAVNLARETDGVVRVTDNLKVGASPQ